MPVDSGPLGAVLSRTQQLQKWSDGVVE